MASARLIRQASSRGHPARPSRPSSRAQSENEPLLSEETSHDEIDDIEDEEPASSQPRAPNRFADLPVYENIWRIRRRIIASIKDPYTLEQLRAPRLNDSIVRPLMEELYDLEDVSIVYCILVNRMQFLEEQSYQAHYLSVSTARARLAELLAVKILRQYDHECEDQKGLLLLANILIAGFEPFQNAPTDLAQSIAKSSLRWPAQERGGYERQTTALEIAIVSDSKLFISSPACQKVVDAIYVGRIIYTPTSFIDIVPDHYKHRSVSIYNPKKAPLFNQYRLNVPRTRNILEVFQFLILLGLFLLVMQTKRPLHFSGPEIVFCIYTFGWILDQLATILEHGWMVYSENLWSFLDVTFGVIYLLYFVFRVHGIRTGNVNASQPALDLLAIGAPFLIPRLAFNLFSENLMLVSLREMMAKFLFLTLLGIWSFAGFFLAMLWLSDGKHTSVTIGKWMVWLWFGLDGTGIQRSVDFHWLLGPLLMIAFAIFGNTLFLTILVSTLSETHSKLTRSSTAEVQYRRAVLTFEGVKSDALFFYQPPFNLLAIFVLLPLKLVISHRWFHKIHITLVRVLNAPLLLVINLFERRAFSPSATVAEGEFGNRIYKQMQHSLAKFSRFHVHGDIQAVFDVEPPELEEPATFDRDHNMERARGDLTPSGDLQTTGNRPNTKPRRKESVWSTEGMQAHIAGLIQEHEANGGAGESETGSRLRGLEASMKRMEETLGKVCETLENANHEDDGRS
ncbi:MAG: hypothetical protein M1831_000852 [Alyxoria varia]|nr:MAG: hypothetical protein M1831_000852 [Alyxoria varia]